MLWTDSRCDWLPSKSRYPGGNTEAADTEAAARALGLKLDIFEARGSDEFERAFAAFFEHHIDALVAGGGPVYLSARDQALALVARHAIPAIYNLRPWTVSGGLMSYGPSIEDAARQSGVYVAQILKGAKPEDLPVVQSAKFEFVINFKTAKALGLDVPQTLAVAADEVIE